MIDEILIGLIVVILIMLVLLIVRNLYVIRAPFFISTYFLNKMEKLHNFFLSERDKEKRD